MTENEKAATAVKDASPKQKRETWGGKGLNVAIIVAAVLTVAGIACWAMQLSGGMVQTGMRNLDSWGLYITNFMFFVGLSAGGLIISSVPRSPSGRACAAPARQSASSWSTSAARPACGSCSCTRTSQAP